MTAVTQGSPVSTKELCQYIADSSTASASDVYATLLALPKIMELNMKNGRSVKLEGIGTFRYKVSAEMVDKESEAGESLIRDYALGESLNEYIKLQFLKSRGRGYEEQMEYYQAMMERAEKTLPIADIHSVESQDESIAIYHAAPYRLTLEDSTSVNTILQQLYSKYKHTVVSRDTFLQECNTFQDWLKSE